MRNSCFIVASNILLSRYCGLRCPKAAVHEFAGLFFVGRGELHSFYMHVYMPTMTKTKNQGENEITSATTDTGKERRRHGTESQVTNHDQERILALT